MGTGLACTSDCKIDTSKCSIVATSLDYCGDGKIDSGEQCDGTDLGGETCSSQKGANWSGSLSCSSNCTFDTNACVYTPPPPPPPEHFCGDGTKDSGEQCDGTDLGGATCGSVQGLYWDGSLSCKSDCTYNTNSCYYNPPIITCIPYTCSQLGYSCGTVSDGCGGTLNCGTCSNGYKCSGGSCIISCTDECSSPGQQICIGSQDIYACGEFDGDPCLDLSSYATCAPAEIYYCCSGTCCYRD